MRQRKHYILTETAEQDFRDAKAWSLKRWGADLTRQYFEDLHKEAEYIAQNHRSLRERDDLTGDTGLCVHPVREHHVVYTPIDTDKIIIVALIRQTRDVPGILKTHSHRIRQELNEHGWIVK